MKTFREVDLTVDKIVYLTPSHAPALVSTVSPYNNFNIGAFEQFMSCSNDPPRIILAITQNSDTYKNIIDGSDFCIGIPTLAIINQILLCGEKLPRNHSEFDFSGLTQTPSLKIKAPHILECSVNLECTLFKTFEVGDHSIVIGDVVNAVIDEVLFSTNNVVRRLNLNAPYYVSSGCFLKIAKIINVKNRIYTVDKNV